MAEPVTLEPELHSELWELLEMLAGRRSSAHLQVASADELMTIFARKAANICKTLPAPEGDPVVDWQFYGTMLSLMPKKLQDRVRQMREGEAIELATHDADLDKLVTMGIVLRSETEEDGKAKVTYTTPLAA
jgi:hypothetical protein